MTLSRVLQSARVAGQARHTVEEAAHGHSRCAGSEDPVPMWRWRRALGRSGEGVLEASAGGSELPRKVSRIPQVSLIFLNFFALLLSLNLTCYRGILCNDPTRLSGERSPQSHGKDKNLVEKGKKVDVCAYSLCIWLRMCPSGFSQRLTTWGDCSEIARDLRRSPQTKFCLSRRPLDDAEGLKV